MKVGEEGGDVKSLGVDSEWIVRHEGLVRKRVSSL